MISIKANSFRPIMVQIFLHFILLCCLLMQNTCYGSVYLNVPFLKQQTPNTTVDGHWRNGFCGYTCAVMVGSYKRGLGTSTQDLLDMLSYLGIPDASGYLSYSYKMVDALTNMPRYNLKVATANNWTIDDIKNRVATGVPVIVGVNNNLGMGYGDHYLVVVGYDDNNIICNDPGTSSGDHKPYSNDVMNKSISGDILVVTGTNDPPSDITYPGISWGGSPTV